MRKVRRVAGLNPVALGLVLVVTLALGGIALFQKNKILTALEPGDTLQAEFSREYRLRPYLSKVKVAGVPVGVVTDVESGTDGRSEVSMKLDKGVRERLGTDPSAAIRPVTLLGGAYYVELRPGGDDGAPTRAIPAERTTVPVELDRVLEVLQPNARVGLQQSIKQLDGALDNGGKEAAHRLVRSAPPALAPGRDVLDASLGTRPQQDLTELVSGLESTARVLTANDGELDSIVRDLNTTSGVLGRQRYPVAATVRDLPVTMRTARAGLTRLDTTLGVLEQTAEHARPAVTELKVLLDHAAPVVRDARPLLRDLRPTLRDATPLVRTLVPTARVGTQALRDVRGPVLDRLNGPVLDAVMSPYQGTGPYRQTRGDNPFYQELAYMFAGLDNASRMTDRNGATVGFQPGIGPGTLGGTPISFEQLFAQLVMGGKTR
jgi:phospholipid/cholesterol/gamma-HCH transport system substrate-binding protein